MFTTIARVHAYVVYFIPKIFSQYPNVFSNEFKTISI